MFAKFIKIMANLSIVAFTASAVWALYCGLAIGNTNAAIIPLFMAGVFYIIFVPWLRIIKDRENSQRFCRHLKLVTNTAINMEQNKKDVEQ